MGSLALTLGAGAAIVTPSSTGCLIPDQCILIISPGHDWCRVLGGAKMWPVGQPEEAVDVTREGGGPPVGCVCFNSAESQVLNDKPPGEQLVTLQATVEQAARVTCESLVPAGYDHNCYLDGPGDPLPESPYRNGFGECVGDCAYTGDCGDPDPYECENIVDGNAGDSTAEGGETGGEANGLNAGRYINCSGTICEVDEGFAAMLWNDPALLLSESTRLLYEPDDGRFEFVDVCADTVAAALGLRDGDILESVNGVIIEDLDAALEVYASGRDARSLRVRVARGGQWFDFTYNVVR